MQQRRFMTLLRYFEKCRLKKLRNFDSRLSSTIFNVVWVILESGMIRFFLALWFVLFSVNLFADSRLKEWRLIESNSKVAYYHRVSGVLILYKVSQKNITSTTVGVTEDFCVDTKLLFQGQFISIKSTFESSMCTHTISTQRGRDFIIDNMKNNKFVEWDGVHLTTSGFSQIFDKVGKEILIL